VPPNSAKETGIWRAGFIVLWGIIILIGAYTAIENFVFPDYIYHLGSNNFNIRVKASCELIKKGEIIIPYLEKEYHKRTDILEKIGIIYILGQLGGESGLDFLIQATKDKDDFIRSHAVAAIIRTTPSQNSRDGLTYQGIRKEKGWPIRKRMIPLLFELLNDETAKMDNFPYLEISMAQYQNRRSVMTFLEKIINRYEYESNIHRIEATEGDINKWDLNTPEKWALAIDFTKRFWKENEPYLYWVDVNDQRSGIGITYDFNNGVNISQIYDKKLKINYEAKLLGIPVDEDTGKMFDLKDRHILTREEIAQIRKNKGIELPDSESALTKIRKKEGLLADFQVICNDKVQIDMDIADVIKLLGAWSRGAASDIRQHYVWECQNAVLIIDCLEGKVTDYWIGDKLPYGVIGR
jgi:hypothetical protein